MIKNTILIILLFIGINSIAQQKSFDSLYEKESITIVVTDSGLGGLSVVADLERNLQKSGIFAHVNLIFANALFDADAGYNSLQSRKEKIEIFSDVLSGINQEFKPDIILIACNTLSVIYKETSFAKNSGIPIIGIVDIGVEQMKKGLIAKPSSKVLIFGTETTIEEGSYRTNLMKQGIPDSRIGSQPCPQLQMYIENNPVGDDTEMLIMSYIDEALELGTDTFDILLVSLNCTHFGYAEKLWYDAFSFSTDKPIMLINPNIQMAELFKNEIFEHRFQHTSLELRVVSKVKLKETSINAIAEILKLSSLKTAQSLKYYEFIPELF
jgi:glutamate racemase